MNSLSDKFHYVHSCDLSKTIVSFKLCTLEGNLPRIPYEELLEDPLLQFSGRNESKVPDLQVEICIVDGTGIPLHCPYFTTYKSFSSRCRRWEWNQWISLPLHYSDLPRHASLLLTVYDCRGSKNQFKSPIGGTSISLFGPNGLFRQGQIDLRLWNNEKASLTTIGNPDGHQLKGLSRLNQYTTDYDRGLLAHLPWLDPLSFAQVEKMKEKEKFGSNYLFLMVEFSKVVFGSLPLQIIHYNQYEDSDKRKITDHHVSDGKPFNKLFKDIIVHSDFELNEENLIEAKHLKLTRSTRTGQSEKELKPNSELKSKLLTIISLPNTTILNSEDKDVVWRYRFYLAQDKKALSKFVKVINWKSKNEAAEALHIITSKWALMDVEDALELLGPTYKHPGLRHYAVSRLRQASDEDLLLYLLQLVQALKYENVSWESLESSTDSESSEQHSDLTSFLIDRACRNSSIANYFYWYLVSEVEDELSGNKGLQKYDRILYRFKDTLLRGSEEWKIRLDFIERQQLFMDKLVQLIRVIVRESGNRVKKIERLQELLSKSLESHDSSNAVFNFTSFAPLEFPLDPNVRIKGVIPERATLFKSSLMPARISFITENDEEYVVIFKLGDDLRQDQLIIQIISLMDRILQQENLDLKLTPYKVLATSIKHGFVQCIDSYTIADILGTEGTIQNFLRKYNPCESSSYGIHPNAMKTYVKSCAGYCVITYLLGVGDRHLDNLLLTKEGRLFHIDFGYILGRDPKPLPPPMKLSKEMIEAFGGTGSEHYAEFRKDCYSAFLQLRRYANLILNLFSLMVDASVPDIALEPDKTVQKVQDKFRLDLSDEEAVRFMQNLIDVSTSAVMAAIVERLHRCAQFWRN